MSTLYTMVAPCFFGTESTLNFEVKRLGAQNIQVTDGRVAFQGGADVIAAANLNLRTAERVLLLLATYKATTFDELFDGCYNIAWPKPAAPQGEMSFEDMMSRFKSQSEEKMADLDHETNNRRGGGYAPRGRGGRR